MRQIVVVSGKGGTGKTSLVAALAHLQARREPLMLVDADVDASNLGLVLAPQVIEEHTFLASSKARVDAERCTGCGACLEACRFDAIHAGQNGALPQAMVVEDIACEGCAACSYACPEQVIRMYDTPSGCWYRSDTRFGPLLHARLYAGEGNSGKLVTTLRQHAISIATEQHLGVVLIDGSPGIGCPVIAAASGADMALLVTEPTSSGAHDLERILQTTQHFCIPAMVCINKADIHPGWRDQVRHFCSHAGIPIAAEFPYDEAFAQAMIQGQAVTELEGSTLLPPMETLWQELAQR
ncbi:MAG: ATP-binding protein [Anaerolineae bacterium]